MEPQMGGWRRKRGFTPPKNNVNILLAICETQHQTAETVAFWQALTKNGFAVQSFCPRQPGSADVQANTKAAQALAQKILALKQGGGNRVVLAASGPVCEMVLGALGRCDVCCDAVLLHGPQLPGLLQKPFALRSAARRMAVCGTAVFIAAAPPCAPQAQALCNALRATGVRCATAAAAQPNKTDSPLCFLGRCGLLG